VPILRWGIVDLSRSRIFPSDQLGLGLAHVWQRMIAREQFPFSPNRLGQIRIGHPSCWHRRASFTSIGRRQHHERRIDQLGPLSDLDFQRVRKPSCPAFHVVGKHQGIFGGPSWKGGLHRHHAGLSLRGTVMDSCFQCVSRRSCKSRAVVKLSSTTENFSIHGNWFDIR